MATICDVNGKKPKIEYPNFWEYKVILDTKTQERKDIEILSVSYKPIKFA